MAKQTGDIKITGTIDDLTFYKMEAKHYVRMKSSLTRKRFFKDARFERSRMSAERFAMGNKLASEVYRMVDEEQRVYRLFCYLKKRAIALLKEGVSEVVVKEMLITEIREFGIKKMKKITNEKQSHQSFIRNKLEFINYYDAIGFNLTMTYAFLGIEYSLGLDP